MMPSPLGRQGGAPSEHPPSAMNRVSTVTDSASPYNTPSPALSFGGSISGPLPPTPPVPPSGFTARRPDDLEAGVNSPPPFIGYHHPSVIPGYPSPPFAGGTTTTNNNNNFLSPPVAGGNFSSHPTVPEERTLDPVIPPSAISFPSGRSVAASDPNFMQNDDPIGFGFADNVPDPVEASLCPEPVRSSPDSFEHIHGLHGTRSPPSTGDRDRAPAIGPSINFYTDLDFPYDANMSPIRMAAASRGVNFSQDNSTTYRIRFEQHPAGPCASRCHLGIALSREVEICFENIDRNNIYQHRFILLCRVECGKVFGLELCPSNNRTIRPFPLLLSVQHAQTNQVISYIANCLLRGSLNGEPGNMKSNFEWYVSTSGWAGGGVVSSYPAALCFNDYFYRLTRKSGSHIRGLGVAEIEAAENQVRLDTRNDPFCPPTIRDYIHRQFLALGIHNFAQMDCFSNCPRDSHPIDYPFGDPFLTPITSAPPHHSLPPPTCNVPSLPGDWVPYQTASVVSNRMPAASVVSGGVSAINHVDESMNDSFSSSSISANTSTEYSAARLESDHRQRQTMIKRIRETKELKMPKVSSEKFLKWKDYLEDELRGSVWRPHGKFILRYTTTDVTDPAIARTSDDLTYILSGCARMQGNDTYSQLLGSGGQQYLRAGLGIELFHHAVGLYNPTGIRATWDGEEFWSRLQHNQSELIDSLSVRIDDAALQLSRTSGLLIPYNEFMCKLKLAQLVCYGPYGDVFDGVMNKICVTQDCIAGSHL